MENDKTLTCFMAMNKKGKYIYFLLANILLMFTSQSLFAAANENHARIAETARAYIAARHPWQKMKTKITVQALDPRTKLAQCPAKLEAFLSTGAKIYLPVTVEAFANVMVARHPIAPNTTISERDISWSQRDISALGYGYLQSLGDRGGYTSRRSIAQGAVLTPNMVTASSIVNKGQRVQLNSNTGPVSVSMMGIALQNGALGSRIMVKNLNSGKQLEGVVASENVVLLN